jgi:hypothetical protein
MTVVPIDRVPLPLSTRVADAKGAGITGDGRPLGRGQSLRNAMLLIVFIM